MLPRAGLRTLLAAQHLVRGAPSPRVLPPRRAAAAPRARAVPSLPLVEGQRDYYEVLGVPRSATAAEIKKACKLAKEHHPDAGGAAASRVVSSIHRRSSATEQPPRGPGPRGRQPPLRTCTQRASGDGEGASASTSFAAAESTLRRLLNEFFGGGQRSSFRVEARTSTSGQPLSFMEAARA